MSEKHTPGPWFMHADPVKNDPFNRIRYEVVATGKTICRIYYSSFEGGPTNAEQDAKLISAAPDLLDALYRLCGKVDQATHHEIMSDPNHFVNVAIRKATGGHINDQR